MNHTRGSWEFDSIGSSIVADGVRILDTPDDYDDETGKWRVLTDDEKATLRLASAAPDMLEALKNIVDLYSYAKDNPYGFDAVDFSNLIHKAKAAISKAEGGE